MLPRGHGADLAIAVALFDAMGAKGGAADQTPGDYYA